MKYERVLHAITLIACLAILAILTFGCDGPPDESIEVIEFFRK